MRILHPIAAFTDNYIWAWHNGQQAWVVDPGDATVVLDWLASKDLTLAGILITHHHSDHTGGVLQLLATTHAVAWGPATEALPMGVQAIVGGASMTALDTLFEVIDVPGHTAGHIAFFARHADHAPLLFCGDTLFSAGCGRLFEGTPAQMLASLDRLAALPDATRVCCAHEYTLANLRFALALEPNNAALLSYNAQCQAWRAAHQPTLPSTLGLERTINPFLRTREPSVRAALGACAAVSDTDVFATLRQRKDEFR